MATDRREQHACCGCSEELDRTGLKSSRAVGTVSSRPADPPTWSIGCENELTPAFRGNNLVRVPAFETSIARRRNGSTGNRVQFMLELLPDFTRHAEAKENSKKKDQNSYNTRCILGHRAGAESNQEDTEE